MNPENALGWIKSHPEVNSIRAAVVDLNGVWRGKRLPSVQAEKTLLDGIRMPLSISAEDIWGEDVPENPMIFEDGDLDGFARPTGRGLMPTNWLSNPTALVPLWMWEEDGSPSKIDPRQVLARVVDRYTALGLTPVTALEMEFYLVGQTGAHPSKPISPVTSRRLDGDAIMSLDMVDHFEGFFSDVYASCESHAIRVDAAISEGGAGQFEINLHHCADAMKSADDATFFKRLVKGIARKHGFAASFMAKPYLEQAGSGMHLHFSVLDKDGKNIFDNGSDEGAPTLHHAVNGLMEGMAETTLLLAPHLNSYRRLAPASHAPTGMCWGYENRTAAIRIPGGPPVARRIEHRVAGSDANPYLVLAAVLGAALEGIEAAKMPIDPLEGDAYSADLPPLPEHWAKAIKHFENGQMNARIFAPLMQEVYTLMKKQELNAFSSRMSEFEVATYLEVV